MTVTKHVDLAAYRQNLIHISKVMSPAKVMAVIKADAYGHGLVEVAKAAAEAEIEILGVLDIETGFKVRQAGVTTPLFAWLHSPQSDFAKAVAAGIELSVSNDLELEKIANVPGRAKIHLKIDTGLSRNGCRPENWERLVSEALRLESIGKVSVVAVWSHLSGTSRSDDENALAKFDQAIEIATKLGFRGYRHVASSPAAFNLPSSRYEMVRIGVSAFGTSAVEGKPASELGLGIPMRVTAEVIAPEVISIGFLHGYFSGLEGKAEVCIRGKLYRVTKIGPLASAIEPGDFEIGDEVVVFGGESELAPTAERLCELVSTVTDELFTGLKTNLTSYSA